ncbi:MAG: M13 family metallopeptidase, partial [Myxococcota bacterium]
AESRDIKKIYNPMSAEQLSELAPQFAWAKALEGLGLSAVPTFVVAQPTAIKAAGELVAAEDLQTLKDYAAFHMIRNHADQPSEAFDSANFEFYSKTLKGVSEQRARWKRGVTFINQGLGEAVGKVYVERHFPAEAKQQMDELVANLQAALGQRIDNNAWMDAATKVEAKKKLSTFEPRIGYATKWLDYSPLVIGESAFDNARAVRAFQWNEQVRRLAGKVDRELWDYPPQTVNASYNPLLNQITFPAGILQPPFFDPNADPAVNYGAIGAVIGHEIGHGFDDQGRRFDEKGLIRDWWTAQADEAYTKLTDALGAQYGQYEPVEGMKINPELTMGENIGDLGGLQMAYAAYHRYLGGCCGGEAPVIDGMTGDQRFFLGWAQVWRSLYTDDALRQQVLTDPHSNPRFRINGIVRNMDPWYSAFGVKPGDALYLEPKDRVVIW